MKNVGDYTQKVAYKWLSVPVAITIILFAGCVQNLVVRWEDIVDNAGYDHSAHNWVLLS